MFELPGLPLLHRKADALPLDVDQEHTHLNLLTHPDDLVGVLHVVIRQLTHVDEAVLSDQDPDSNGWIRTAPSGNLATSSSSPPRARMTSRRVLTSMSSLCSRRDTFD